MVNNVFNTYIQKRKTIFFSRVTKVPYLWNYVPIVSIHGDSSKVRTKLHILFQLMRMKFDVWGKDLEN